MQKKANTMASSHNGQKLTLKYLFTATFADGHVIKQTPQDKSEVFLPESGKSQFSDVLHYEQDSQTKLVKFSLESKQQILGFTLVPLDEFSVDLITGKFSHNGAEFEASEQNFEPTEPLRLVYFRETRKETDMSKNKVVGERFYINKYYIGWQTLYKGKNYQCTIGIDGK